MLVARCVFLFEFIKKRDRNSIILMKVLCLYLPTIYCIYSVNTLFSFYKNNFIRTRARDLMENEEQNKNKAEPEALS